MAILTGIRYGFKIAMPEECNGELVSMATSSSKLTAIGEEGDVLELSESSRKIFSCPGNRSELMCVVDTGGSSA